MERLLTIIENLIHTVESLEEQLAASNKERDALRMMIIEGEPIDSDEIEAIRESLNQGGNT